MDVKAVDKVTQMAKKAMGSYYAALDHPDQRPQLAARYYPGEHNHVLMNWNGHVLRDVAQVTDYLANLPKTHHTVRGADVQPLPGNAGSDCFMLTITGVCKYDDEHDRHFYQRMVWSFIEGHLYIVNDYYRWTGESSR